MEIKAIQLKLKQLWENFLGNLKNNPLFIHIFWAVILFIITSAVSLAYQSEIKDRDKIDFNRKDMAARQSSQYFDDRTEIQNEGNIADEIKNNNEIWKEIPGSPFEEFSEAGLLAGTVSKDTLNGLVWSSRSAKPLTNEFTADKASGAKGGEALAFCDNLNKIKYAGYATWQMPVQKQLMQAYVDGASRNLADINYVWSRTEFLGDASRAWMVNISAGDVASNKKSNNSSIYVICAATE
ncbi:hypothetical protein COU00_02945 [Candidatus Falkowbacteria bacterium CG10_big_fil_rev_8_21_14_0_10_43_11]|uniref:Lcl C-terminal domain-containing protein n=1 Tax=Candidatus Falkowbacteria bacterium CG10_big_fil_rev_8_21_14_0_10_43_11 TaxID=1974568 RepID=A0A2M6WLN9_9BACT|nr:MAG: hypothetical protein COU00_02945 [Candidatus Falkowbacteria bacterium CG10_big_fil_rev_8_21_14_0_10_43_11]